MSGTTDATITESICFESIPLCSSIPHMVNPYSSDVLARFVVIRNIPSRNSSSNTPIVIFVFPISIVEALSSYPAVPNLFIGIFQNIFNIYFRFYLIGRSTFCRQYFITLFKALSRLHFIDIWLFRKFFVKADIVAPSHPRFKTDERASFTDQMPKFGNPLHFMPTYGSPPL